MIVVARRLSNVSDMSWQEQVKFQWDDDEVRFVNKKKEHFDDLGFRELYASNSK